MWWLVPGFLRHTHLITAVGGGGGTGKRYSTSSRGANFIWQLEATGGGLGILRSRNQVVLAVEVCITQPPRECAGYSPPREGATDGEEKVEEALAAWGRRRKKG